MAESGKAEDEVGVDSKFVKGWYSEVINAPGVAGRGMNFKVDKVLFEGRSKFQDVVVFKSTNHGNILTLDGLLNNAEVDEFAYQELLAHLPLNSHPNPENVLIIGGGDGGIAREVVKHPAVKSVTLCEIDDVVIQLSKKYFPELAKGFESPKLTVHVGDGFKFMQEHENEFDVIITDSSDAIGPAEALFTKEYYQLLFKALKEDGLLSSQGQTMWIKAVAGYILELMKVLEGVFPVVDYAWGAIPSYNGSQCGYLMCSKNPKTNFKEPCRELSEDEQDQMELKYYHPGIHRAAFVHPQFVKNMFQTLKN